MSVTDGDDYPRTPRDGVEKLLGKIDNGLRELREMRNNLLSTAGITVSPAGLSVASSLSVTGDLAATGNTTIDGTLDVGANTTIGGTLDVTGDAVFSGDLDVPNGSITNDALAAPVTAKVATQVEQTGWSPSTSWSTKATTSISVPAGFSEAIVTALGMLVFNDPGINTGKVRCRIESTAGQDIQILANPVGTASPVQTRYMTGLSVGTITIDLQLLAGIASGPDAANQAIITGTAIFFR